LLVRRSLLHRLLVEKELSLSEIRAAATSGDVVGLESLRRGDMVCCPGSVAVMLLEDGGSKPATPPMAAVATISDDALELAVKSADAAFLLEDIVGQPPVAEILAPRITGDAGTDEPSKGQKEKEPAVAESTVNGADPTQ